jgi:hypothetical protein
MKEIYTQEGQGKNVKASNRSLWLRKGISHQAKFPTRKPTKNNQEYAGEAHILANQEMVYLEILS